MLPLAFLAGLRGQIPATPLAPGRPTFLRQGTRQSLPQASVMSMHFGPDGRLWAGTQDGAAWYDGRDWNPLDLPGREVSNYVEAVLPASDGSVWFGRQDGGIACWRQGVWTRYARAEGLPVERVNALAETTAADGTRTIWAGTFGGGLYRFEQGRFVAWQQGSHPLPSRIWRLIPSVEHPGSLWVCGDQGLARVEGDQAWSMPGIPRVSINAVLETRNEQGQPELWLSTFGRGMARYAQGRLTYLVRKDGLPSNLCTDVAETRSLTGRRVLWFATVGGLVRWEGGRLQTFDSKRGLPTDTIYRLKADPYRADGLWVGTHGAGILYYREGGWLRHDALSGLPGNIVLALAPGLPGPQGSSLLAGTHLGVARWQGGRWDPVPIPPAIQGNRINALVEIPGTTGPILWVGSLAGLARHERGHWKVFQGRAGEPPTQVTCLHALPGPQEDLWIGTQSHGLLHYRAGRWTRYGSAEGFPSDVVLALASSPDPDGGRTLWVGLKGGGLARLRKGVWRYWNRDKGFPNNVVAGLCYAEGSHGPRLWIGTQGRGILYADPRSEEPRFHLLEDELDELPSSKLVYQIGEDHAGRVYAATPQGVLRLAFEGGNRNRLEQYTEADGLPASQCTSALTCDAQGHLWVGTVLGAGELDTSLPEPQERDRPLGVTLLIGESREVEPRVAELQRPIRSLTFIGTLHAVPRTDRVQIRSQLQGLEDAPSSWTRERSREFLNLAAGKYTFLLWARDDHGRVLGPFARPFRIPPAWWETWAFRLSALTLASLALASVIRWRMRAVTRQNAALELLVAQRTHDLGDINDRLHQEIEERARAERVKDEFLAVVSHELRTPLTAIRGALGLLNHEGIVNMGHQSELVGLAERNSLRLLSLVNDLLDIQKVETGNLSLTLQALELGGLTQRAVEAYRGLSISYQCAILVNSASEPLPIQGDPIRLEQVMANLLSNAVKFSPPGGTVRVAVTRIEGRARVSVTNLGPPIPASFRGRIFQKFAQADGTTTRAAGGTGLGLAISKALVEAHQGSIGFVSEADGTTFWFELPIQD